MRVIELTTECEGGVDVVGLEGEGELSLWITHQVHGEGWLLVLEQVGHK